MKKVIFETYGLHCTIAHIKLACFDLANICTLA